MNKPVLYLAGPMRGHPRWGFDAFDDAAAALRRVGYTVISPADLDRERGHDPDAPGAVVPDIHECMRADIEALLGVEAIALLDDWETSQGVLVEVTVGSALGLPIRPYREFLYQPASAARA